MKVRALVVLALALLASISLVAQTCSSSSYTNTLICTLPQLFGPEGMIMANPNHNAHFAASSQTGLSIPLNSAIGQQLATLPLGSSGSGATFTRDAEGNLQSTEDSLGPILTERANVIGKGAFSLGVAYQYFSFEKIDGINLNSFPAVLLHDGSVSLTLLNNPRSYKNDYVTTANDAHLSLNQTVLYAVFGITKHMDASIELPIQAVHFSIATSAHLVRTQPCEVTQNLDSTSHNYLGGTCTDKDPNTGQDLTLCGLLHFFGDGTNCGASFNAVNENYPTPGSVGLVGQYGNQLKVGLRTTPPPTDAAGIGDITVRAKYEVVPGEKFVGSIGLGARFPSGDVKNLLGTGAFGVIPFGSLTYRSKFSPHVRVGYEWNSKSILAGDVTGLYQQPGTPSTLASSASLPPAWLYSGGVDYRVQKWLTLGADLIGQRVLSAERLTLGKISREPETDGSTDPATESLSMVPSVLNLTGRSYSYDAVAVGGKVGLGHGLILTGNATIRVDDGGLRANVVPLVGLSWSR